MASLDISNVSIASTAGYNHDLTEVSACIVWDEDGRGHVESHVGLQGPILVTSQTHDIALSPIWRESDADGVACSIGEALSTSHLGYHTPTRRHYSQASLCQIQRSGGRRQY